MDSETLTYLLRQGHVDMPTRMERGLWPHPPIRFDEVIRHLIRILKNERWFPHIWQPAVAGEFVQEGGVIERKSRFNYVYHWQRHHPLNPCVLAEQYHRRFFSARGVARHYLKWDLNLPGNLDGWKVIP